MSAWIPSRVIAHFEQQQWVGSGRSRDLNDCAFCQPNIGFHSLDSNGYVGRDLAWLFDGISTAIVGK